jgi:flagellar motility protein MotE (MotC chaperone)
VAATALLAGAGTGLVASGQAAPEAADHDAAPGAADHGPAPESRFGQPPEQSTAPTPPAAPAPRAEGACLADESAIADLRHGREELARARAALAARQKELDDRARALDEQLKQLESVRAEIAQGEALQSKENEAKVAKLVETLETMSPKAASALVATLDEQLAVAAMERMSTPKLAKIMNNLEPARSSRLTEIMAGVARARKLAGSPGGPSGAKAPAAATNQRKGGESDGNVSSNRDTYQHTQPEPGQPADVVAQKGR